MSFDLPEADRLGAVECPVGMATAAAMFRIEPGAERAVRVEIELKKSAARAGGAQKTQPPCAAPQDAWQRALRGSCRLEIPDATIQRLYETAVRTLVLLTPGDVFPGPYTYKRFWFRDAVFILHALANAGFLERVERALDRFPARQTAFGYFHSQNGEWDSNGQALWMFARYCELSGARPKAAWLKAIVAGARWIRHKLRPPVGRAARRLSRPASRRAPRAERLLYWDDFWSRRTLGAAPDGAVGDRPAAPMKPTGRTEHGTVGPAWPGRGRGARRGPPRAVPPPPTRRDRLVAAVPLKLGPRRPAPADTADLPRRALFLRRGVRPGHDPPAASLPPRTWRGCLRGRRRLPHRCRRRRPGRAARWAGHPPRAGRLHGRRPHPGPPPNGS